MQTNSSLTARRTLPRRRQAILIAGSVFLSLGVITFIMSNTSAGKGSGRFRGSSLSESHPDSEKTDEVRGQTRNSLLAIDSGESAPSLKQAMPSGAVQQLKYEFDRQFGISGKADFRSAAEFSERLKNLYPTDGAFRRLDVQLKALTAATGQSDLTESEWKQISNDLIKVQNEEKMELSETIDYVIAGRGMALESLQKIALHQIKAKPNDSVAHEVLGFTYWRAGARDEGKQELAKAIELDPENSALRTTWESVQMPNAGIAAYPLQIHFRVENQTWTTEL